MADFDATRLLMAPHEAFVVAVDPRWNSVSAGEIDKTHRSHPLARGPLQDESLLSDPLDQRAAREIEGRTETEIDDDAFRAWLGTGGLG